MNQDSLLPDAYFEALGQPKPGRPFNAIDDYRFHSILGYLAPGSVLDVGVYFGDLLKLARAEGRPIFGTEVNEARVTLANKLLGQDIVRLDFRNGQLKSFDNDAVDNVVCTEVVEHVPDHSFAISELCRVARRRVIITVPFREQIATVMCLHCAKYTPHSGHLHSYDLETFTELVPRGWGVIRKKHFAKKITRVLLNKLRPKEKYGRSFGPAIDLLAPGVGHWLLVVLAPERDAL